MDGGVDILGAGRQEGMGLSVRDCSHTPGTGQLFAHFSCPESGVCASDPAF